MNKICLCLFFLLVLAWMMHRFNLHQTWILVFWMIPVPLFMKYFIGSDRLVRSWIVILMAAAVFFQDLKTMYFSGKWLVLLFVLPLLVIPFEPFLTASSLMALIPGLTMAGFWRKGVCGSADVMAMIVLGFVLGWERFLVCLLFSCLMGLLYSWLSGRKQVPFLSFLAMGFLWGWMGGYRLFDFLSGLFIVK